ncbi:PqqD family protein [Herbiconiux sp. KACC 21604]|uniref:PqqD family protein n=1 Tax=unclassified Herbiconiux TaxID=2618217 RepID=UPI0014917CB8|nr:PqqD family protein [Herbiconiux sp. SALV-R1]QJU54586.1 PqqD family protein [Herbiconiux sp. SALV-R1]WPO85672.1 PqqD family protein [Herbiconiux sp. KACC 21604]
MAADLPSSDSAVWCRRSDIAFVEEASGVVVLPLSAGNPVPLSLENSAWEIWKCIDGVSPLRDILRDLAHLYGTSTAALQPQVTGFLVDLERRGLVRRL